MAISKLYMVFDSEGNAIFTKLFKSESAAKKYILMSMENELHRKRQDYMNEHYYSNLLSSEDAVRHNLYGTQATSILSVSNCDKYMDLTATIHGFIQSKKIHIEQIFSYKHDSGSSLLSTLLEDVITEAESKREKEEASL